MPGEMPLPGLPLLGLPNSDLAETAQLLSEKGLRPLWQIQFATPIATRIATPSANHKTRQDDVSTLLALRQHYASNTPRRRNAAAMLLRARVL